MVKMAMKHRHMRLGALLLLLGACPPTPSGGDEQAPDLAPRPPQVDLSACMEAANNLLRNGSFEADSGMARNIGQPPSSIDGWDGCCNSMGQGLTTTWQVQRVPATMTHCGSGAVLLSSMAARDDVLNQTLTIADGAGKSFTLGAWVLLSATQGDMSAGSLVIDLYDLGRDQVIAQAPLGMTRPGMWSNLVVSGTIPIPMVGAPRVQVRVRSAGTLGALVDDVSLVTR